MISICAVTMDRLHKFTEIFIESATTMLPHVSEILIANVHFQEPMDRVRQINNVTVREFTFPVEDLLNGHSMGLHGCLDRATAEYVMFSDPDVLFYQGLDDFYLSAMKKYELDFIGISHHAAVQQAYTYFPTIVNSLVRRSCLPDENFLKGKIKKRHSVLKVTELLPDDIYFGIPATEMPGKWLLPNPIPEMTHLFPNKDASIDHNFDAGCNLWLWGLEKNWRWLAFQTLDCHLYTSKYCRGNVKVILERRKLLWHLVGSSTVVVRPHYLDNFLEQYRQMKENE